MQINNKNIARIWEQTSEEEKKAERSKCRCRKHKLREFEYETIVFHVGCHAAMMSSVFETRVRVRVRVRPGN